MEHYGAADGAPMEHLEQLWSTWSSYGALGAAMEQLGALWSTWSSYGALGAAMEHYGALGIRVELALPNCCRCDAPSSVAAEVVSVLSVCCCAPS
jgi:hypothetical protein